jgi:hypothetical protein
MTRRILGGVGTSCALVLTLPAAVYLHGSTLPAVMLTAALASGLAAAVVHRGPRGARAALRTAATAAAGTVSAVVVLTSTAFLVGGTAASRIGLVALPLGAFEWLVRKHPARLATRPPVLADGAWRPTGLAPEQECALLADAPVAVLLSTSALGRESLRTSAGLARPLRPAMRDALAARRRELLDELERRDPAGFVRRGRAAREPA